MNATLVGVSSWPKTLALVSVSAWRPPPFLALRVALWLPAPLAALGCSVFPDQAVLPGSTSNGGTDSVAASAGAGAEVAGSATVGGTSGAGACPKPEQRVLVGADTWIDSAKPTTGHGNDRTLSVVGGAEERRALLGATLPAAPAGMRLLGARLVLQLQANADAGLAGRKLQLHQLEQAVSETHADWNSFDSGNKGKWRTPGGDFGAVLAEAELPAGTSKGEVSFDVATFVDAALAPASVSLALIVVEGGEPPAAAAELAFTSREGDASGVPALILELCQP